jgi:hypothetical protein
VCGVAVAVDPRNGNRGGGYLKRHLLGTMLLVCQVVRGMPVLGFHIMPTTPGETVVYWATVASNIMHLINVTATG